VRTTQYFEMLGSRSIYHAGWKATTDHVSEGVLDEVLLEGSRDLGSTRWHLFDLDHDFSESTDLAGEHPERVAELEARWWAEADANQVLPLSSSLRERIMAMEPPVWPPPRRMVLHPGYGPIADEAAPSLAGGALLTAELDVPDGGGSGVLCAMGDWHSGWALLVLDGRPAMRVSLTSTPFAIDGTEVLPAGRHDVAFRFRPDGTGGGVGTLLVDGRVVAAAPLPPEFGFGGIQIGGGGLRLGHDAGFPVSDDYWPPFAWTGTLHSVVIDADAPESTPIDALLHRE